MRTMCFSAFVFAVLVGTSFASNAAPAGKIEASTPVSAQVTESEQADKVKLNSADAYTLQRDLFGIGASKAKAIIAHRENNGAFTAIDELLEVKGIGKALLEKNRNRLELN